MKLTAILGSPRAGGNTDILAKRVVEGAQEAGLETEILPLRTLKINKCIGCEKCWTKGRACVFDDDMQRVIDAIAASDIILFATPVYWYGPTSLMKVALDRFVAFNRPQGRPLIEGKGAVAVIAYEEEGPTAAEPLMRMFELSFDYLGVDFFDKIVADGLGPKGAVLQKPDVLEQARDMGKRLADWSGKRRDV